MERTSLLSPPEKPETRTASRPVPAIPVTDTPPPPQAPPTGGHEDEVDLNVPEPRPLWVVVAAVAVLAVLGTLLVTGLAPRQQQKKELDEEASYALTSAVLVDVTRPRYAPPVDHLALPATLRPWQETSIFARTTGYLKHFSVDISDQVKAGQLMAEVASPELDQQLLQAKAAVAQAKATVAQVLTTRSLSQITYDRYKKLFEEKSTTPQDLDEKHSALEAANATVTAAEASVTAVEASVNRLTEMQQFERVTAPFDGVVTGRSYDVGSLILADPTSVDVRPMYKIAENDVLRVFVNVPQSSALRIVKGMDVQVTARERPGESFAGKVMGTTNYLDPGTRTLLTEVKVVNATRPDGTYSLLPGMSVTANIDVKLDHPPLVIPAPALVTNAEGTQVATVRDGSAHFKKVKLGDDYGREVEVVEGLTTDDLVIATPGERVVEGVAVRTQAGAAGRDQPAATQPAATQPAATEPVATGPAAPASQPTTRPGTL